MSSRPPKRFAACMLASFALAGAAVAQPTINAAIVTSAEDPTLPAGVLVVDLSVTIDSGDDWNAGGLRVEAAGGLSLRYARDPNTGERSLTAPDLEVGGRHVTFVNVPRDQFINARFRTTITALVGGYDPVTPSPETTSAFANVAYTPAVPILTIPGGYTARAAFDIVGDPPGFQLVSTDPDDNTPGPFGRVELAVASDMHHSPLIRAAWNIVPEPATLLLVVIGGLALRMRP